MFINIEKGKTKLYDLKIYDGIKDVCRKLKFESPYENQTIETTSPFIDGQIIGKNMVYFVSQRYTGKKNEHNDSLYYPDERVYECWFREYHLTEVYFLLERLMNSDYSALEQLNKYYNHRFRKNDQKLFNKHESEIFESIKLVELVNKDFEGLLDIYEALTNFSDGNLKEKLMNLKKYLNIYEMNINKIPRLIR